MTQTNFVSYLLALLDREGGDIRLKEASAQTLALLSQYMWVKPTIKLIVSILDSGSSLSIQSSIFVMLESIILKRGEDIEVLAFYAPITKRLKSILQKTGPPEDVKIAALSFLAVFVCSYGNDLVLDSVRGLDRVALHILTTTHHNGLKVAASKCLLCYSAVYAVTP